MTGRDIEYVFPDRPGGRTLDGRPVLEVAGLSLNKVFADVSFSVAAGEIVGLAGLVGLRPLGDPRVGVRRPQAVQRHRDRRRQATPGRLGRCRGQGGDRPRSRGAQEPGPAPRPVDLPEHHRLQPRPVRPRQASSTARPSAPAALEWTKALDVRPRGVDASRPHPVRRQPAEGRAGPLAAARLPGAAARRADPRRRRGRAQRDLRPHPLPGCTRAWPWSSSRARSRRSSVSSTGSSSSARDASCTADRPTRSTSTGSSTW